MTRAEPLLEARDLAKRFGAVQAVLGLNLCVRKGDLYGLVGLNGAGKTTTLRMLVGLITPTSGTLAFRGETTHRVRPRHRARLSALIEMPSIFARLSGFENVLAIARLSGPVSRADVERHLAAVGLLPHARRPAGDYSLGMKQRLALAIALASSPEVLILDEPTNGLDPEGIRDLRHTLVELNRGGMTIIVSSHLLSEVERFATAIGVMRAGRMVVEGPIREVLHGAPALEVTARPADRALAVLAKFGEATRDGDTITVTLRDGETPAIARALVEAGVAIEAITPRRSSLEALVVGEKAHS